VSSIKDGLRTAQGGFARDRAAVVATAIIAIVVDGLREWLHGDPICLADIRMRVSDCLRDEFADIKREVAGEREPPDAA
jgi:hypothetical protein